MSAEVPIDQANGMVEPHKKQNAGVVVVLDSVIDNMRKFRSDSKITQHITIYLRVHDVAVQSCLCVSDVFEVQTRKLPKEARSHKKRRKASTPSNVLNSSGRPTYL